MQNTVDRQVSKLEDRTFNAARLFFTLGANARGRYESSNVTRIGFTGTTVFR